MKQKVYKVQPDPCWGDDRDKKRLEQLNNLELLGLSENEDGVVYCYADQVISLIKCEYVGTWGIKDHITPVFEIDTHDIDTVKELMTTAIDGVKEATQSLFNDKCSQHQPGNELMSIDNLMLLEDSCTDALQDRLNQGWRIIAVCPQPDSRRPDYILGRNGKLQEGALRE